MSTRFSGSVIPGTLGKNDWTYPAGNPGLVAHFVVGSDSLPGILYITDRDFSSFSQSELASIFNACYNQGRKISYTGYKMAWYETNVNDYVMYNNVNGSVVTGTGNKGFYFVNNNGTYQKISNPTIDGTYPYSFNDGIPMFSSQTDMDNWLLSSDTTTEQSDNTVAQGSYNGVFSVSDGVLRAYTIDDTNNRTLAQLIGLGALGGNIGQAIIGEKLVMSPGALVVGSDDTIVSKTIGGTTYAVTGKPLGKQGQTFDFGTFNFVETFHNFMDYYDTTIKLYLPYCGMQDLDPSIVMGGSIHLYGTIDLITGNIVYYLEVNNTDVMSGASTSTLYSFNGNCSCDLPLNSEDYGRKVSSLATGVLGAGAAGARLTGGNPFGAMTGVAVGLMGSKFITEAATKFMNSGRIDSNNGFGLVQYPYVIINVPKPQYPANYGHDVGYPCEKNLNLGSLSGFTKVERIHLSIPGAMQSEIDNIERLLKEGVVF